MTLKCHRNSRGLECDMKRKSNVKWIKDCSKKEWKEFLVQMRIMEFDGDHPLSERLRAKYFKGSCDILFKHLFTVCCYNWVPSLGRSSKFEPDFRMEVNKRPKLEFG